MNKKIKLLTKRITMLAFLIVFVFTVNPSSTLAMTTSDLNAFNNGYAHYDPLEGYSGAACGAGGSIEGIDDQREAMIRAIIGVAKAYNLGQKGALIGLMAGLAESRLTNPASDEIPESKKSPDWLAISEDQRTSGSDHDSIGLMQQRPSTGWSTYGGNYDVADSETKRQIAWQIMNPVYAAQAFFGTPPNAQLPSSLANPNAIRKGVQNKDGWQSKDPWVIAQDVQVSAYDGNPRSANNFNSVYGGNYKAQMEDAQDYLSEYWDSSSAVQLAIDVAADEDAGSSELSCGGSDFASIILAYAHTPRPSPAAYHFQGSDTARNATEAYKQAVVEALDRGNDYVGGGSDCGYNAGIDCGGFVTRVMRDSGLDPNYNSGLSSVARGQRPYLEDNTVQEIDAKQMREQEQEKVCNPNPAAEGEQVKYARVINVETTDDLCPADIWINHSESHTYIHVGTIEGFEGDKAGASISTGDGGCAGWRAPMAGTTYGFDQYWYRKL